MDLFSKKNLKNLLEKQNIRPSKKLGQNFLIDKKAAKKIIKAAEIKPFDIVLEIGPGIGNLTNDLAKKAKKIIAVEKDIKMVEILKETLKGCSNVKIILKDILKISNFQFLISNKFSGSNSKFKIVANLPYYIASAVIRKFLESKQIPEKMILTVQKEVAQRICACPPNMNLLAVSVQFYAKPKIISFISKKSFWPCPKVDSAIIEIKPIIRTNKKNVDSDLFFKIVKAGFSHPRKQILNNLSKKLKLDKEKTRSLLLKSKINPEQRAETLFIDDWIKLTTFLI